MDIPGATPTVYAYEHAGQTIEIRVFADRLHVCDPAYNLSEVSTVDPDEAALIAKEMAEDIAQMNVNMQSNRDIHRRWRDRHDSGKTQPASEITAKVS